MGKSPANRRLLPVGMFSLLQINKASMLLFVQCQSTSLASPAYLLLMPENQEPKYFVAEYKYSHRHNPFLGTYAG